MLDFPSAPTVGQDFVMPDGTALEWDGAKWQSPSSAAFNDTGRNLIHNSRFNVAQRGTGPFITSGAYTADRWALSFTNGSLSVQINPASDAGRGQVGDEDFNRYLTSTWTGTAAAADHARLIHGIEGVRRLGGKTVTLSFWALASVAGVKVGVSLDQIFGTTGSPSPAVTLSGQSFTLAVTWARYTATFTLPSVVGATLGTDGNDRTQVNFWFSSGATNNARAGGIGVQPSGLISIWGVQLEVGSTATPLEKPDPQQDLAKCQRFYQVGQFETTSHCSVAGTPMWVSALAPVAFRSTNVVFSITAGGNSNTGVTTLSYNGYCIGATALMTAIGACAINTVFTASADL